jgi:heme exporter protein B
VTRPATLVLLRRDLLQEWRGRARLGATLAFGITTLLLFSFGAGPDPDLLRAHAAGYLWLAMMLTSTLSLAESFRTEMQNQALDGVLLLPTDARAVYYGKMMANLIVLFGLGVAMLPFVVALYDVVPALGFARLIGILGLGCLGIAAPGTLYAALSARARGRDVLLPLLLFPLIVPALLAAVSATGLVIAGDPMDQLGGWTRLLAAFDAVYAALCGALFARVVEDG